jgi:hypothetical protein
MLPTLIYSAVFLLMVIVVFSGSRCRRRSRITAINATRLALEVRLADLVRTPNAG